MIIDIERARRRYAPSIDVMRKNLPDVGQALDASYCELAHDMTLPKLDELSARLNAARTNLGHLRLAMLTEQSEGHGTG